MKIYLKKFILLFVLSTSLEALDLATQAIEKVFLDGQPVKITLAVYNKYKSIKFQEPSIVFDINTSFLTNQTCYLVITSDLKNLKSTNTHYEKIHNSIYIKLDRNTEKTLYFNYSYKNKKRLEFRYAVIEAYEYNYLLPFEGILYGISYGIIFSAFLYYLFIYFSTHINTFLYYSLMQINVLLSLIGFVTMSYASYPTYLIQALTDIFETLGFLFTLLFAREILNTKERMKYIDVILYFFIIINFLDLIAIAITGESILYEHMPFYIIFILVICAGIASVFMKNYYAIIYSLAWLSIFSVLYLYQINFIPISSIYAIHLAAPLESLILSFALALSLKKIINEKNEKEKLLIHKSKLASMGEMINNIAHQWRQPLMHLSYINMNLHLASEDNDLTKEYLYKKVTESDQQLEFMSKTINNFKDFYKPEKEKEFFYLSKAIQKAFDIMEPILETSNISFEFQILQDKEINAYENEYSQVILNLLTNAKDVLISRVTVNPHISITLDENITTICDNAGGIEMHLIDKVFEPYFTTKDSGSGIGLYMSKTIIESHFKGSLELKNISDGICASIQV